MIMRTVPHDSLGTQVSDAKDLGKTQTEVPNAGRVVKIGDFRQITRYNSNVLTIASAVNLVWSQVCHNAERPPLLAARLL